MLLLAFIGCHDFGWRKHVYDLPPDLVQKGLRLAYALDFVSGLVECLIKLSILCFTRRMLGHAMSGSNRYYFAAFIALFAVVVIMFIAAALVMGLACRYEKSLHVGDERANS